MLNLYDYDLPGLEAQLLEWDISPYYAGIIWRGLYQRYCAELGCLDGIRPDLMSKLEANAILPQPNCVQTVASADQQTIKYLLKFSDGETIETVQMAYRDRITACLSTQAGCAMGCIFCATGQMGFRRQLTPGEIVGQALFVNQRLEWQGKAPLRNIVLMGMGEPLHNYDNVMTAIRILTDQKGLAIGERRITLSTVGLPDPIRRLADEGCPVNLAVSLHAADDAERMALIPVAAKWRLPALIDACRYYAQKSGRRIFFEWTLIAGQNDSPAHAQAVGMLLDGIDAHLNVIPLNPTQGYAGIPSDEGAVAIFQQILADYGIPSTVRQRRGIDIGAGCGQLRTNYEP